MLVLWEAIVFWLTFFVGRSDRFLMHVGVVGSDRLFTLRRAIACWLKDCVGRGDRFLMSVGVVGSDRLLVNVFRR